jgi:methylated-DNA-protein-cysteine methyltransferase related protein
MTAFSEAAAAVIASIPPGRVATYREIASMAGNDRAARQVARLLHSSSGRLDLPWHRVIGSDGSIRLPEGGGREEQAALLQSEGVEIDSRWRVDLSRFSAFYSNEGLLK